ncbi:Asp-tRNA(Asn)/Glu-tRNA(Gln) amidotransferase subunit GatA [Arachnia rubra]|jgi:aspartyl/glutamyl-tRNA(asn/gln) amidotransferase, A subunit|uniref:Glutamyl-tRNA(Gln) amidotransferase subunit A n=1 Tax=Arachnia rubra TaxID=1547448 RepID=A0ABX7Y8A2_9ACTN|nr:Asp-tRNA(Asn)/Glu-tRNA(Gln) amidotransferase subunit GatA [Arachnia rubra]MDO4644235.1 Asp-tRNA(Asn)/Glu-tRNA(Gln) amidotransferase subunit GatA [Propionibacteriaceae bacterium]QUC09457.1 Asp-tRNA(Asn)/Glu-tRNA(Gln) amidotransferase subunit GatA [Arachnia rubra]BCR80946.1 glutamyl-tRNA(Gln) amidotransferase subunit A [Arachnia rubra]
MTEIITRPAHEQAALLAAGEISAVELAQAHLDQIEAINPALNAFLHVDADGALATAAEVDARRAAGERLSQLAGVPIAVKDNFCTSGLPTTCGSRMLEGWIPPYDATVVTRLKEAGLVILGKTNMDEFAMGSSTETSAFGPSRNPWDLERIPGGSGGGSSAAIAGCLAPLALGSDTGGSIRQPGAVTGTVGVKPTYGAVSRYGVVAMASSLDQPGPVTRGVLDAALLQEIIGGHDPMDSTSIPQTLLPLAEAARRQEVAGLRIGVVREFGGEGYDAGVEARFAEAVQWLRDGGAEVVEVSCPHFEYALAAYYLIMPAELSSNLARFDAVRYGLRLGDDGSRDMEAVTSLTRAQGFGREAKRRLIIGTYALSSGYHDQYYGSAQKVRTLVARDFEAAFATCDVLVSPTTPTVAFRLGERTSDPMAMYKADLCTIPSNLAGNASASFPVGLSSEGLPVGLQVIAPPLADDRLYRVGGFLEGIVEEKLGGPLLRQAKPLEGTRAVW